MDSLAQYLKPPQEESEKNINNDENMNQDNVLENENNFEKNQENGDENGENQEQQSYHSENKFEENKNIENLQKDLLKENENEKLEIQGVNLFENKQDNEDVPKSTRKNENENENENENFFNNDIKEDALTDILNKIHKIRETKTQNNISNILGENNNNNMKNNNLNDIENILNAGLEKIKSGIRENNNTNNNNQKTYQKISVNKNNKYNFNINKQIVQNNPKMKELIDILKVYTYDNNSKNNNNDYKNISKPDEFFNNNKSSKRQQIYFNEISNYHDNKHYVSCIDGKAIINGQRKEIFLCTNNSNKILNSSKNNINNSRLFEYPGKKLNLKKNNFFSNEVNSLDINVDSFVNNKRNKSTCKIMKRNNTTEYNLLGKLNLCNNGIRNGSRRKNEMTEGEKLNFKVNLKKDFLSKNYFKEELRRIKTGLYNKDENSKKNMINKL